MSISGLPHEWTLSPWAPTCVDATKAESSVDVGEFAGYVHVFLFLRKKRNTFERWYVITYRNPVFHNCEIIYGFGTSLDDALKMAKNKWEVERQSALYALGVSEEEFSNRFCAACEVSPHQWVECIYCNNPFDDVEENKDEIVKTLDDLSPTIRELKRTGMLSLVV